MYVVSQAEARRVLQQGNPVRELLLAIEILSPSSARHDRVTKLAGYVKHVSEYWIVDLDARLVERWRRQADHAELLSAALTWQPAGARAPLVIELVDMFARVHGEAILGS